MLKSSLRFLPKYKKSSITRQKHEYQNGCFKKTKHAKFSEKRTCLTPWYAHVRLRKISVRFRKFDVLCTPVLRLALLPYFQQNKRILGRSRTQIHKIRVNIYYSSSTWLLLTYTTQKMRFSIKDFFSKCDQICRKLLIWPHSSRKEWILLIKVLLLHLGDNSVIWWELLRNVIVCCLTYSETEFLN